AQTAAKALDDYSAGWASAWARTCGARNDESPAMFDMRVTCLSQRLHAFDSTIGALTAAKAMTQVAQLEPIAPCEDRALLSRVAPPPQGARVAVAVIDAMLDHVTSLRAQGQFIAARLLLDNTLEVAHRVGYRPREASAEFWLGDLEADL